MGPQRSDFYYYYTWYMFSFDFYTYYVRIELAEQKQGGAILQIQSSVCVGNEGELAEGLSLGRSLLSFSMRRAVEWNGSN